MNPLSSAPALVIFTGWCAGLSASSRLPSLLAAIAGTLVSASLLLVGTKRLPPGSGLFLPLTLLTVFLPLFVLVSRIQAPPSSTGPFHGDAVVLAERSWGGRRAVVLETSAGNLLCLLGPDRVVTEGTRVRVNGRLCPLDSLFPRRDGDFNAARYWKGRGVDSGFELASIEVGDDVRPGFAAWRTALRKRLLLNLPPLLRGHLLAAWAGEKDPEIEVLHRRWGTAHLLAVSGFHVGLLALMVLWCLQGFRFKLLWSSCILWGYVFLTGAAPSAVRAMVMIQLALLGTAIAGSPSSALNSVAVAGAALLAYDPWLFWDVGWRLSVISVLVLCSFAGGRRGIPNGILASLAVWLATAGEASRVFGFVPMAGLALNLIALPVFSILLPVASIAAIPALLGVPGGGFLALGMEGILETWTCVADRIAFLLPWELPYGPLLWALSAGVVGAAAGHGLGLGRERTVLLSVLAILCGLLFRQS